jgi:hypothetical protein
MKSSLLTGSTLVLLTALSAHAGSGPLPCDCNGDPGYVLTIPPAVGVGEDFDIIIEAPGRSFVFQAASFGEGPINTRWGCFCLDWPFQSFAYYIMPASGYLVAPHTMPCEAGLVGTTLYSQFLSIDPTQSGISNQVAVDITDSGCYDACSDGKPAVLTMVYTGDSCDATHHSQDPGNVFCSGDPAGDPSVYILACDKRDPNQPQTKIWFEGEVGLGGQFDVDSAYAGLARLNSTTFLFVYDQDPATGGVLLQDVEFHTSCSQPLHVGDQFGCALLTGFVGSGT